jgi:hypothetical protein
MGTHKRQVFTYKGKDSQIFENYLHKISFTNEKKFAAYVEIGDRRKFVVECSNEKTASVCGIDENKRYFDELLDDLNAENGNIFYQYLMQRDIKKWKPQNIPDTKLRKELMYVSLPIQIKFIGALVQGRLENLTSRNNVKDSFKSIYIDFNYEDIYRYQTEELITKFKLWMKDQGYKSTDMTNDQFVSVLDDYGLMIKPMKVMKNESGSMMDVISIQPKFIVERIRNLCKNPDLFKGSDMKKDDDEIETFSVSENKNIVKKTDTGNTTFVVNNNENKKKKTPTKKAEVKEIEEDDEPIIKKPPTKEPTKAPIKAAIKVSVKKAAPVKKIESESDESDEIVENSRENIKNMLSKVKSGIQQKIITAQSKVMPKYTPLVSSSPNAILDNNTSESDD